MSKLDSTRQIVFGVLASGLLAGAGPALATAQESTQLSFLRKVIQLDQGQLAAVEKGEIVTKQLRTTDKAEVAAFGVVKTAGTVEQVLAGARNVLEGHKIPQIPEAGLFSSPAKLEDLGGLHYPPDDITALKKCKSESCDVKLGTNGLAVASRIDWNAADAEAQAIAALNQLQVGYVDAYRQGGTEAMSNVLDKKGEKSRATLYRELLANSPYLVEYEKKFNDYLESYPKGTLPGAEDVLYWAKDTFGPKPVVSIYHQTLYKSPRAVLIATKLVAASHFFNASLELTAAVPTPDGKSLYLMCLDRSRIDPPTGMLAGALMGKVRGGVETGVKETLKRTRERLAAAH